MREARTVRLRDFGAAARRDVRFFAVLLRERALDLRDLAADFLAGRRLRGGFEIAFASLTTLRTVLFAAGAIRRLLSAALPAMAPATPPTTAPIGPAMLPMTAPATAPAVSFGIGGISMFLDDSELSFFCASGLSGIAGGALNI